MYSMYIHMYVHVRILSVITRHHTIAVLSLSFLFYFHSYLCVFLWLDMNNFKSYEVNVPKQ